MEQFFATSLITSWKLWWASLFR